MFCKFIKKFTIQTNLKRSKEKRLQLAKLRMSQISVPNKKGGGKPKGQRGNWVVVSFSFNFHPGNWGNDQI